MKSPILIAAVVAAGLAVSAVSVASTNPQLAQSHANSLTPATIRAAVEQFRGDFDLNDGRTLSLSRRAQRLFVNISGEPAQEIRAQTATRFTTVAGGTAIEFHQLANGIVASVTVTESGSKAALAQARKVANPG